MGLFTTSNYTPEQRLTRAVVALLKDERQFGTWRPQFCTRVGVLLSVVAGKLEKAHGQEIANALVDFALKNGATHYAHWSRSRLPRNSPVY